MMQLIVTKYHVNYLMYQLIHTAKLLLSFSNNVHTISVKYFVLLILTLQLKIMENLSSESEHGQKVPDMQEMVQIL